MQSVKLKALKFKNFHSTELCQNFVLLQFAGNRTWHVILHSSNAFDNNIACADATYSIPNGNTSLSAIDLYIMRWVLFLHDNLRRPIDKMSKMELLFTEFCGPQ